MDEKLRKLMKHEGLNSSRLAEVLGIQASGISHIMSGRNKPSYDFLLKLLQRFPQINPDWLLLDKGPMYRDEIKNAARSSGISPAPVGSTAGSGSSGVGSGPGMNAGAWSGSDTGAGAGNGAHAVTSVGGLFAGYAGQPGQQPQSGSQSGRATQVASTDAGLDNDDIIPAVTGPGSGSGTGIWPGTITGSGPGSEAVMGAGAGSGAGPRTGAGSGSAEEFGTKNLKRSSAIERIVVFYKDKTFSEYQPE